MRILSPLISGSVQLSQVSKTSLANELTSSLNSIFATDSDLTGLSSSLSSDIVGLDGRLDTLEGKTLLSSSVQISTEISGAFTLVSESLSSRVNSLESFSSSLDTIYATDQQLSSVSSSLAQNVTSLDGRLDTLEGKTLLSSSVQIGTEISGAFTSPSSSIASDIVGLDGRLDTLEGKTLVSGSQQITLIDTTGDLSGSRIQGFVSNSISASYAENSNLFDGLDSSVFALTSSNTFIGDQSLTGSLSVTGPLTASGFTYPTVDGLFGVEVLTTNGSGKLTLEIPETLYEEVKNNDVITIPKGTPVKVTGYIGNQALVVKADAGIPSLMPASYILAQELAPQAEGLGIILGRIQNINTTGLVAGEVVYVGVGGGFTQVRPTGSAQVQPLGFPVRIDSAGSGVVMNPGVTNDLPNLTQGYMWVGGTGSVPTTITSSSFAKVGENSTFTGTQTFNNIQVNGTGSFNYIQSVTGSAKIIGDAYIVLNNDLPAEPFAGIKVIDSGSTNVTASLVWDGSNNHWVYENISGSSYGAAGFMAGPRSTDINNILYPTQYKVLRSQGGDHLYDSNITDNDTNVSISIPLSVTGNITSSGIIKSVGGFEGNVTGNSSTSTTSSYVEYSNVGNKPTLISSSAQISSDISGSFTDLSSSLSGRVYQLELFSSSLDTYYATDIQLSNVSSSLASDVTGLDGRLDTLEGKTLLSSSVQISNDISGAFTSVSSSIASDVTSLDGRLDTLEGKTLLSSSNQIAGDISGAFISVSSSLASDVTSLDGRLDTLEGKTLVSGSSQLTSSYDQRYTLSGSITDADWNTLQNKPAGIVSSSVQLNNTSLSGMSVTGSFTGSFVGDGSGLTGVPITQYTTTSQTFTSTGSITVQHNLGTTSPLVQVYNSLDELFLPQVVKIINQNTVRVDFSSPSTGKVVIGKGGHIISGSVLWGNINNIPSGLVSSSSQVSYSGLTGVPSGIVSSSAQLNNSTLTGMTITGSFSGSFAGVSTGVDILQVQVFS